MTRSAHSSAPPPRRAARAAQRFRARLHRSVIAGAVALLVGGSGVFAVAGAYASSGVDITAAPSPSTSEVPVETSAPSPIASPDIAEAAVPEVAAAIDAPEVQEESTSGTASVEAEATPTLDASADTTAAIADGQALARVENGEIWAGDGYFRTSFDYILNEGVESTEVIVKVWKGVFQYEEEVASDSTGVFTKSGRYDHTFKLPAGEYTFAALIYHQGENTPRFDRAYDVTVTESASKPELKITSFKVNESRFPCVPSLEIDFAWMPDAPESEWANPDHSRIVVLVVDDEGAVVGQTNIDKVSAGGGSASYFIDPGHYTVKFEVPLTGGGTTIAREESVEVADPTIVVSAPQRVGNTVVVPTAPDGAEYFNVATGQTVTGTLDLADTGTLTLDARSINGCSLKYDGPWTYVPNEDTFVILTSDPHQTVRSDGEVTITFDYDLRPDTEREGIAALLDVYIEDAAGERTVVGKQLIGVDGPATFDHSVTLKPGTYTRYITSTYLRHCDCMPIKDIVEPYTFTVPEQVTPTWPVQEGNTIKVVPQPGVIFTDKDGNVLTGDVPVPEDGLTVKRMPEQGYAFPERTDTEKTYENVPPVPQPTEVTPVFPKQAPGNNVITFAPQPGVIFTDADGNVIDGSFTVTEGKTTITATPAEGYTFPSDASTERTYVYYAVTPTPAPQPTASPSPTATVTPSPQPSASASAGTGPGSNGTGNSGSKSPSGSTLATTGSDVSGITAGVAVLLLLAGTGTLMARAARRRS